MGYIEKPWVIGPAAPKIDHISKFRPATNGYLGYIEGKARYNMAFVFALEAFTVEYDFWCLW